MRGRRASILCTTALVAAASLSLPSRAVAQVGPKVSLNAGRDALTFGGSVKLWGRVSNPPANANVRDQTIRIVNVETDTVLARTTTDRRGRYNLSISPSRRTKIRAQWVLAGRTGPLSSAVTLRVRPIVRVALRRTLLFGKSLVKGSLRPAHPGARITVVLRRHGRSVVERRVRLRHGRRFRTRVPIRKPGGYRARAHFNDADHLPSGDLSGRRVTPLPSLGTGSRGKPVKLLERRLRKLRYHIAGVNRRFDTRTRDALIAFNKVQGRVRSGSVSADTWRALASPRRPRPRFRRARFHFEIDQTKQVIYMVRRGRVRSVLHTSTGAGGRTRDGTFRVHRKVRGFSPNRLYYPSYFDGLRAMHGWPTVPTFPASHGCARVPMWTAKWLFRHAPMGAQVRVYH